MSLFTLWSCVNLTGRWIPIRRMKMLLRFRFSSKMLYQDKTIDDRPTIQSSHKWVCALIHPLNFAIWISLISHFPSLLLWRFFFFPFPDRGFFWWSLKFFGSKKGFLIWLLKIPFLLAYHLLLSSFRFRYDFSLVLYLFFFIDTLILFSKLGDGSIHSSLLNVV